MNRKLYPVVVAIALAGCAGWEGGSVPAEQAEAQCQSVAANSVPLTSAPGLVARGHGREQVFQSCMKDKGFYRVD